MAVPACCLSYVAFWVNATGDWCVHGGLQQGGGGAPAPEPPFIKYASSLSVLLSTSYMFKIIFKINVNFRF